MDKYEKIDASVMWNMIKCSQNFYTSQIITAVQIEQSVYDDAEFFTDSEGLSYTNLTGGQ